MLKPIESITELLDIARHRGGRVDRGTLTASGLMPEAVAAELRRRGYEVKVTEKRNIQIIAPPIAGARRRQRDQTKLFTMVPTHEPPRGFADSDREE